MKFFQDFKEFAIRGNVVDMGIGVILGTAFGQIVDSLVKDILMPPIGLLLGQVDFSNLYINLSGENYKTLAAAKEAGVATINYGLFFNTIIHFTIVGFATFATVHQINRIRKVPIDVTSKECPYCFSNIPTRAKRCPQCTTIIEEEVPKKEEMRINIKAG